MGYYNDLAFHLRRRHLSDAEVVRILKNVRRRAARAKAPPADAVGPAGAYARTFPRAPERRWFLQATASLYAVGALFALFVVLGPEVPAVGGADPALMVRELGRFPVLRLVLPYLFLVAAAEVVYLCRLPAGFEKKPAGRGRGGPAPRPAPRRVRAGSPPRSRRG